MIHQYSDFRSVHCTGNIPRAGQWSWSIEAWGNRIWLSLMGRPCHGNLFWVFKCKKLTNSQFVCSAPPDSLLESDQINYSPLAGWWTLEWWCLAALVHEARKTWRIWLWKWCSLPTGNLQISVACKVDSLESRFTTRISGWEEANFFHRGSLHPAAVVNRASFWVGAPRGTSERYWILKMSRWMSQEVDSGSLHIHQEMALRCFIYGLFFVFVKK